MAVPDTGRVSRDPYVPIVTERDGRLLYRICIERGHASFYRDFPVDADAVRVLRDDAERYDFLFAALHHPYQMSATNLSDGERERYFSTILFAGRDEVEAFMTARDRASNGAVENLPRIVTQADYRQLRAGRWFGMGGGTPACSTRSRPSSASTGAGGNRRAPAARPRRQWLRAYPWINARIMPSTVASRRSLSCSASSTSAAYAVASVTRSTSLRCSISVTIPSFAR